MAFRSLSDKEYDEIFSAVIGDKEDISAFIKKTANSTQNLEDQVCVPNENEAYSPSEEAEHPNFEEPEPQNTKLYTNMSHKVKKTKLFPVPDHEKEGNGEKKIIPVFKSKVRTYENDIILKNKVGKSSSGTKGPRKHKLVQQSTDIITSEPEVKKIITPNNKIKQSSHGTGDNKDQVEPVLKNNLNDKLSTKPDVEVSKLGKKSIPETKVTAGKKIKSAKCLQKTAREDGNGPADTPATKKIISKEKPKKIRGPSLSANVVKGKKENTANNISERSKVSSQNSQIVLSQQEIPPSQPPSEYNLRERLEWLRARREVGIWVQCCNSQCSKWRYLGYLRDPQQVPRKWYCSMNKDKSLGSCEAPERGPTAMQELDLIENEYTAGSVVWARLTGYPWWPAMVDDDPDVEQYYWVTTISDIPTHYNVVFFDEKSVTRAWITPGNLRPFTGIESNKEYNVKIYHGTDYSKRLEFARKQAKAALDMDFSLRLQEFGFLARFKGPFVMNKATATPKSSLNRSYDLSSTQLTFEDNDDLTQLLEEVKQKKKHDSLKKEQTSKSLIRKRDRVNKEISSHDPTAKKKMPSCVQDSKKKSVRDSSNVKAITSNFNNQTTEEITGVCSLGLNSDTKNRDENEVGKTAESDNESAVSVDLFDEDSTQIDISNDKTKQEPYSCQLSSIQNKETPSQITSSLVAVVGTDDKHNLESSACNNIEIEIEKSGKTDDIHESEEKTIAYTLPEIENSPDMCHQSRPQKIPLEVKNEVVSQSEPHCSSTLERARHTQADTKIDIECQSSQVTEMEKQSSSLYCGDAVVPQGFSSPSSQSSVDFEMEE